jgi:hypothetical protein
LWLAKSATYVVCGHAAFVVAMVICFVLSIILTQVPEAATNIVMFWFGISFGIVAFIVFVIYLFWMCWVHECDCC